MGFSILEWVAVSYPKGSSQPRDQTCLLHWQVGSLPLAHMGCLDVVYDAHIINGVVDVHRKAVIHAHTATRDKSKTHVLEPRLVPVGKTLGFRGRDGGVRGTVSLSAGMTVGQTDKLQATPALPRGAHEKMDLD